MKFLLLKLSFILVAFPAGLLKMDFGNFIQFTVKNYNPPESVARLCNWQYAIIKLYTNSHNEVFDYKVMNAVSTDFEKSLAYLKGYQFDRKMPIKQRSILFCLSLINLRTENCDTVGPDHRKLLKGMDKLKEYRANHKTEESNSIFIDKEVAKQIFDYQQ